MSYEPLEPLMRQTLGDLSGKLLKFTNGNAKLDGIPIFSLPAGWACPGAHACQSRTVSHKENVGGFGVQDGPACQFRCFAATDESKYPTTREARWHNFILLKDAKTIPVMVNLIQSSLPTNRWGAPIRLHVAGDFFSQAYFDAWIVIAKRSPKQVFYAYTKSLPFWVARLDQIPSNFRLTASKGGKWDALIEQYNLKCARVVYSTEEADKLNLEIDHDDSHAFGTGGDFALLLHGTQPAGSLAAKAWSSLKSQGIGGYHNQKMGRESLGQFYQNKKKKLNVGGTTPHPIGMIIITEQRIAA